MSGVGGGAGSWVGSGGGPTPPAAFEEITTSTGTILASTCSTVQFENSDGNINITSCGPNGIQFNLSGAGGAGFTSVYLFTPCSGIAYIYSSDTAQLGIEEADNNILINPVGGPPYTGFSLSLASSISIAGDLSAGGRLIGSSLSVSAGIEITGGGIGYINGMYTAGPFGVPVTNDIISLTGQGSSIAATTIISTTSTAQLYRCSAYAACTTAGSAGTLSVAFNWVDDGGFSRTQNVINTMVLTSTGFANGSAFINSSNNSGGVLSYSTTVSGAVGSPKYSLYLCVERIQ